MLYKASYFEPLGETRIELVANSHSDSWPMLRRLIFRKTPIDLGTQSLPLAAAILTRAYCGDVFEFAGIKIGSDYADAIRVLLPAQANVVNVDGFNRSFSTGEVDVAVNRAGKAATSESHAGNIPLARVDWSGDFVDVTTRNSAGFAFGTVQTNAALFADPFSVSVAVGLLHGRDRCGKLFVSPPATDRRHYDAVSQALRIVGVTLVASLEDTHPVLARAG